MERELSAAEATDGDSATSAASEENAKLITINTDNKHLRILFIFISPFLIEFFLISCGVLPEFNFVIFATKNSTAI